MTSGQSATSPYRKPSPRVKGRARGSPLHRPAPSAAPRELRGNTDGTRRDFTLTWTLDSPPAEVFRAWTDPDHLDWFYNDDNPVPIEPIELDLRVGGIWRQHMVIDESTAYVTGGVYREIVHEQKLVFAWGATDGWPKLDPDRLDDSPLVTAAFTRFGGRTEMTVHVELPASFSEDRVQEWWSLGMRDGWRDTVDRLAAGLARAPAAR